MVYGVVTLHQLEKNMEHEMETGIMQGLGPFCRSPYSKD